MAGMKKIVIKSRTALSLNERFTYLRQQGERSTAGPSGMLVLGPGGGMASAGGGRVEMLRAARAQLQRASARNRRLALQMENRPAVAAALRIKKRNMRLRQGLPMGAASNVKERLSLPTRARLGWRGTSRGGLRGTLRRPMRTLMPRGTSRGGYQQQQVQRGGRGFQSTRGRVSRGGLPRGGFVSNRGGQQGGSFGYNNRRGARGGTLQMRGGQQRGGRGQMRGQRGGQQGQRGFRRGAGQRGFQQRGGRGGRGGARGTRQPVPSRDELDSQLDAYMAGTRITLDRELDQYMNAQ